MSMVNAQADHSSGGGASASASGNSGQDPSEASGGARDQRVASQDGSDPSWSDPNNPSSNSAASGVSFGHIGGSGHSGSGGAQTPQDPKTLGASAKRSCAKLHIVIEFRTLGSEDSGTCAVESDSNKSDFFIFDILDYDSIWAWRDL